MWCPKNGSYSTQCIEVGNSSTTTTTSNKVVSPFPRHADPLAAVPAAVSRGRGALAALAHVGVQGEVHRFEFEPDLLGVETKTRIV